MIVDTRYGHIRHYSSSFAIVHRLLDGGLILASLIVAIFLTGRGMDSTALALASGWAVLLFQGYGSLMDLYGSWRTNSLTAVSGKTVMVWFWTVATLIVIAFLTKTSASFSRVTTTTWFLLTPLLLIAERTIVRALLASLRTGGRNTRTLAFVGKNQQAINLKQQIDVSPWMGFCFVGYFDDREQAREGAESDVCHAGRFSDLIVKARAGEIDYVYITLPMRAESRIVDLVAALSDTTASVYFVPNFFVFDLLQGKLTDIDGIPALSLHETPFSGASGWIKRVEDVAIGSLIMLMISLPMIFIAAGVKLSSPGPVLFKQRRYGLNGQEVEVWKFRSMTVCEDGNIIQQATRNDSRVTPFGAFLRRTSLDELPQFINVLQGTMSIVGPRPHAVAHNEQYRGHIRGYMLRHKVKPGITGLAQINGWRGETDTIEKMSMRVKYDLAYMRSWSLWLDIKIIAATAFKGFSNSNAY